MSAHSFLAAVDIGTNSFHLIIVKATGDGNFEIVDREREVIRLGEGFGSDIKMLSPDAVKRAVSALTAFKGIADTYDAELHAVATSAVREAKNKDEFIRNVHEKTGVRINVISGFEEARLIYLGVLKAVPVFDKRVLCIDIGGGSTEFLVGESGDIIYSNSLKLGAVRLSKKFFPDGKVTKQRIAQCREWVEGEIFPVVKSIEHLEFTQVVGSSGTIQAAASIGIAARKDGEYAPEILNNYNMSIKELSEVEVQVLSRKETEARTSIKGLESKRADIIPAGIIILTTILNKLNARSITISGYALREGIILDALRKSAGGSYTDYLFNIRLKSIEQLASGSNYDVKHCRHVAELAIGMFDQLKELHKLDDEYREYLFAAAILHDIGHHISHDQHHKHSYYVIRNSNILGFTDIEIVLIASIARYHRKSHPKKRHEEFKVMPEIFQQAVRKLASILRVADALDRTHTGYISNIKCSIKSDKLVLSLEHDSSDIDIELWNLERRKGLFEETYGLEVIVS